VGHNEETSSEEKEGGEFRICCDQLWSFLLVRGLSGEIAKSLPRQSRYVWHADYIEIELYSGSKLLVYGIAGGLNMYLDGDANDYVGKGNGR